MTLTLNGTTLTVGYVDQGDPDASKYYYIVPNGSNMPGGLPGLVVKDRPMTFEAVKTDANTDEPVAGAKFALHKEIYVGGVRRFDDYPMTGFEELVTSSDGLIPQLDNTLPPGKYQLRELEAPAGYQALGGYVEFEVSSSGKITLLRQPEGVVLTEEFDTDDSGTVSYVLTIPNLPDLQSWDVSVWKTDAGHTAITTGASFALYKASDYNDQTGSPVSGAEPILTGTTGADGLLSLGELNFGEYRLVETAAPDGYNMSESAIKVFVDASAVTALQAGTMSEVAQSEEANPENPYREYWVAGQPDDTWQVRVWNNPGMVLPSTGGPGTCFYTLAGLALLAFAPAGLVLRRGVKRGVKGDGSR